MKRHTLPSQIVTLVSVVVLAVLSIVWFSLLSVRQQMDIEAADESESLMAGRIGSLQEQVSLIASDYHNWTDLFQNAQKLEYRKLASNYGITAERGDVFQYAELFDGPFRVPVSWSANLGLEPQNGILSTKVRNLLRVRIRDLNHAQRETVDYFEVWDGRLVMFSASYLLPEDETLLAEIRPEVQAIGAIGKVLSAQRLSDIGQEFSLAKLNIVTVPPLAGTANVSVLGVSAEPIAWIEWQPPTPGSHLFEKTFPIMGGVSIAFILISFYAARLLLGKTEVLIEQEAVSFKKARIDALTKLPNRVALLEHLDQITQYSEAKYAILAIDLVRFKQINDTVGHHGGDMFLVEFSRRLQCLADETTLVSRYGGDEFFIAICATDDFENIVREKCRKLMELSAEPIRCKGVSFDTLCSKGVATSSVLDQEDLICRADRAMYSAKARRSQEVVYYDNQMASEDLEYKKIVAEMRRALVAGGEFEVHYQPIVSTIDPKTVIRYEALARWSNDKLGSISPEKFIHVAEASGLIVPLGWVLLDIVCRDVEKLDQIGVNISPAQLMTPGFAMEFADRVATHGCRPNQLELEITEQVVAFDDITIANELSILHNRGFKLALDDFGTGYSSIGYLTKMPFDVLKIDRSFIRSMHSGTQGARILRSIVGLARSMDLEVVAEGVQKEEDVDALRVIGVDYLQGYHLGKPAPVDVAISSKGMLGKAKFSVL